MFDLAAQGTVAGLAGRPWDVLVIGGGITGAGVLREAARHGLRALLLEQNDFASGTSSRSTKLVHGGLHYLAERRVSFVREAVRERERLVREGAGLVEECDFLFPTFTDDTLAPWQVALGLGVYDLLSGRRPLQRRVPPEALREFVHPAITPAISAAFQYRDARTDDARLVLRVLREACRLGGHACNYVAVTDLLRDDGGRVVGARVCDRGTGAATEVRAPLVINATGPWADRLTGWLGARPRLRLLRGSHLVFPRVRLRVDRVLVSRHPESLRPICVVPWEGVTLVGSTSVEHAASLDEEPRVSPEEAAYLLRAVQRLFPSLHLRREDVQASFAGVRAIADPDPDLGRAARDHAIWDDSGMLTVTGGKLTTFRLMALAALRASRSHFPGLEPVAPEPTVPHRPADSPHGTVALRSLARYGPDGALALAGAPPEERQAIPGTSTLWWELRWTARTEAVRHLDDLLLRRLRIGLTTPLGGIPYLERIRTMVQRDLEWDDCRWCREAEAYREHWHAVHGLPSTSADHPAGAAVKPRSAPTF
jgi:glycerol-3-phosphate dehydrogenase